jgi:opacity protein-like surface antigen
MKRISFAAGLFLLAGAVMNAQEVNTPQFEVGMNYSWLHVNGTNGDYQRTGNGGSGYFEYNVTNVLGLVGDVGGYANTRTNNRALTYMFGPRFNLRHWQHWTPYVQFLFGGAYAWTDVAQKNAPTRNSFAMAAGGGLDYQLTKHIALKPFQVEYLMTEIASPNGFGSRQNDLRYSAGVAFRFGSK